MTEKFRFSRYAGMFKYVGQGLGIPLLIPAGMIFMLTTSSLQCDNRVLREGMGGDRKEPDNGES